MAKVRIEGWNYMDNRILFMGAILVLLMLGYARTRNERETIDRL